MSDWLSREHMFSVLEGHIMNLCSDGVIDEEEYERRSDLLNAMDAEQIRVEYNEYCVATRSREVE